MRQIKDALQRLQDRLPVNRSQPVSFDNDDAPDFDSDAAHVAAAIQDLLDPERVLHIGSGIGRHLQPFHDNGVVAHGIDPNHVALENAAVPQEHILLHDFQEPYKPDDGYDVVLCFDLVDYLEYTDGVLETMQYTGDIAIIAPHMSHRREFTVDEQRMDALLEDYGMHRDDELTTTLNDQLAAQDGWFPHAPTVYRAD